MKLFLAFLVVISPVICICQSIEKTYRTVQVIKENEFYLNGGRISMVGGKSRLRFKVPLPSNTVKWYYAFTTEEGDNPTKQIQLFTKLTRAVDTYGITELALNELMSPKGTGICDVYITNTENSNVFMEKSDYLLLGGKSLLHHKSAFRGNSSRDVVPIDNISHDDIWICFKNPSPSIGVNVKLEVVAIVEETNLIKEWTGENKQFVFDLCYEQWNDFDYCSCVVENLVYKISFSEMIDLANFEGEILMNKIDEICTESLNRTLNQNDFKITHNSTPRIRLSNIVSNPKTQVNQLEAFSFYLTVNENGKVIQITVNREKTSSTNQQLIQELENIIKQEVFYETRAGEITIEMYTISLFPSN